MSRQLRHCGFSLTETLLAVGTLAVGMLFVAGTYMTGIYFSTVSTERSVAAVVADEAFAKIRLYDLDPDAPAFDPNDGASDQNPFVPYERLKAIPAAEFLYPSTADESEAHYAWAAICKRVPRERRLVQVTVFVSRLTGTHAQYWARTGGADPAALEPSDRPRPVSITVTRDGGAGAANEVRVSDAVSNAGVDVATFINARSILVDDATGEIYRVLERYRDDPDLVKLDRAWSGSPLGRVWTVPPARSGGRSPLVAVYQRILRF